MAEPIVSVAGIRGILGTSLVPDDYLRRLLAFASMANVARTGLGITARIMYQVVPEMKVGIYSGWIRMRRNNWHSVAVVPIEAVALFDMSEHVAPGVYSGLHVGADIWDGAGESGHFSLAPLIGSRLKLNDRVALMIEARCQLSGVFEVGNKKIRLYL